MASNCAIRASRSSFCSFRVAINSSFNWISVIRMPVFVTKEEFEWAVKEAEKKKKIDCSKAEFITITEGECVQIMHIGPYDDEPATVALMDEYIEKMGYKKEDIEVITSLEKYPFSEPCLFFLKAKGFIIFVNILLGSVGLFIGV